MKGKVKKSDKEPKLFNAPIMVGGTPKHHQESPKPSQSDLSIINMNDNTSSDNYKIINSRLSLMMSTMEDLPEVVVNNKNHISNGGGGDDGSGVGNVSDVTHRRNNSSKQHIPAATTTAVADNDNYDVELDVGTPTIISGGSNGNYWKNVYGSKPSSSIMKGILERLFCNFNRDCSLRWWSYITGFLFFFMIGILGASLIRFTVYMCTGTTTYYIGKLFVSKKILCLGDVIMISVIGFSSMITFFIAKYIFKEWMDKLTLYIVGIHVTPSGGVVIDDDNNNNVGNNRNKRKIPTIIGSGNNCYHVNMNTTISTEVSSSSSYSYSSTSSSASLSS